MMQPSYNFELVKKYSPSEPFDDKWLYEFLGESYNQILNNLNIEKNIIESDSKHSHSLSCVPSELCEKYRGITIDREKELSIDSALKSIFNKFQDSKGMNDISLPEWYNILLDYGEKALDDTFLWVLGEKINLVSFSSYKRDWFIFRDKFISTLKLYITNMGSEEIEKFPYHFLEKIENHDYSVVLSSIISRKDSSFTWEFSEYLAENVEINVSYQRNNICYAVSSETNLSIKDLENFTTKDLIHYYLNFLVLHIEKNALKNQPKHKESIVTKALELHLVIKNLEPNRYLPLGIVADEWSRFMPFMFEKDFTIEDLENLVVALRPRILGLSHFVGDILEFKNDQLFPLWKEIVFSIENEKYLIAQSGLSNIINIVRDTRCKSFIKEISESNERKDIIRKCEIIMSNFDHGLEAALMFALPFVITRNISPMKPENSINRHGTVHAGNKFFSDFNTFSLLLLQCKIFLEMYKSYLYPYQEIKKSIFKSKEEW